MNKSLSRSATERAVIDARGLVKTFGRVRALDGLDLTVRRGEVHGFLGPNSAGKSTTIRAILGQLRLTAGELTVLGRDPLREIVAVHERLAYVPGDTALWPGLTGGECIDLLVGFGGGRHGRHGRDRHGRDHARARSRDEGRDRRRRDELIARFELDPTRRARTYSKGNRQKVALIAALSADVDLYLLDEPTSGLDPLMEARFRTTVRELEAAGRTVLLSSHILDEVEELCDRVTIIRAGRTVSAGTLDELRTTMSTRVTATTAAPVPGLDREPGVSDLVEQAGPDGIHLTFAVTPGRLPDVLASLAALRPTRLSILPPSLDELFLEHYEDAS